MKNIVWISSYPKSGNTWIRYLLANYFYNIEKRSNINVAKLMPQFPPKNILSKYLTARELKADPFSISKYWIRIQEEINQTSQHAVFLKNHNALLNINGNNFTNELISSCSIYLVRDPRDVAVSYSFFLNKGIDDIIDRMCSDKLYHTYVADDFSKISFLGSWKFNYSSWRDGVPNMPKIIIKYEDLLKDTKGTLTQMLQFLSKEIKFKINKELVDFSIERSTFKNLQSLEIENKFKENSPKNQEFFFRKGLSSQWKDALSLDQIKRIENNFNLEMKELNYL